MPDGARESFDHPLHLLFHPRSVAVVGASGNPDGQGYVYLKQLLDFPFPGPVYPVSVGEKEILGVACHDRLTDIDGPVDHVISCLPQHLIMPLLDDCAAKGVRSLHLYTARLAETQLADRVNLEERIVARAREGNVRIVGPNCMGLYCPASGLTFRRSLPREPGSVAFLSQSGGHAADLEYQGAGRGLRFSKIVSFGNASDLNESDFLDYLLEDPETKVIGVYLEGVKEGRRFLDLLRRADGRKPVVLYKAGRTTAGARAVRSHTASMSGEAALWDAVCRQFGVVVVNSIREMADVLLAFQFLPPFTGRRALIMGGGGGGSVAAADACESEGFEVPPLPEDMREKIRALAPRVWSLISNPMDGSVMDGPETMARVLQLGAHWDGADVLIGNTGAIWLLDDSRSALIHEMSIGLMLGLGRETGKPLAVFVNSGDTAESWRVEACLKAQEACREAGVPVYPNTIRCARALARFNAYHRRREGLFST